MGTSWVYGRICEGAKLTFCRLYSLPPLMLMLDAETQAYDPRAREAQGRSGVQGQSGLYEILLKKEKRDYF